MGALAAAFGAWLAIGASSDAKHAAQQLLRSQGKLVALEDRQAALESSLRKLHGRVAAYRRWGIDDDPPAGGDRLVRDVPPPIVNGDMDPELAAELALQNAPAAAPGR